MSTLLDFESSAKQVPEMDNDEYEGKISAMNKWAEVVRSDLVSLIRDFPLGSEIFH